MATDEDILSHFKTLGELDHIVAVDKRGNEVLRIGYVVSLFFQGGHSPAKRHALVNVVRSYCDLFREQMSHYQKIDANRLTKISGRGFLDYYDSQADALPTTEPFDVAVYGFPNGVERNDPTPFTIRGGCDASVDGEGAGVSSIDIYLPITPFEGKYQDLIGKVMEWSVLLQPLHGTCGLGTVFEDWGNSKEAITALPLIKRFVGLDFNKSNRWTVESEQNIRVIRTINWLNVLDDGFVAQLGGVDVVTEALGPDCPVHTYDGGVIIQAGSRPQVGDVNRGLVPEQYRAVAKLLRPLVFEAYTGRGGSLLRTPDGTGDLGETLKWIRRFY